MKKSGVGTARWLFGSLCLLFSVITIDSAFTPVINAQESVVVTSDEHRAASTTPVSGPSLDRLDFEATPVRHFTMTHLFQLTGWFCVLLMGYSLATAGKYGRGWFVLAVMIGIVAVIGKAILSLFIEVANSESMPDWDEEE